MFSEMVQYIAWTPKSFIAHCFVILANLKSFPQKKNTFKKQPRNSLLILPKVT